MMGKKKNYTNDKRSLSIYWKIQNFSFGLENVRSPVFNVSSKECYLELNPKDTECKIVYLDVPNSKLPIPKISFVPCDGSKALSRSSLCLKASKDVIFGPKRSVFLPEDTLTVLCQFWNTHERGKVLIRSRIGVNRKCFLWTLRGFSKSRCYKKLYVENSHQYGDIQLNIKYMDEEISDEEFYIEISRIGGVKCYCCLKVSVLDVYGKAFNYIEDEFVFEKEDKQQFWKFSPVMSKTKLLASKNILLPNDTLSLKCEFVATLGTLSEETTVFSYYKDVTSFLKSSNEISTCFQEGVFSDSYTDLVSDLEIILDYAIISDVSLQVGSEIIKVHKVILSAESPIFDDIFKRKEICNIVVIEDLDADTLRGLLFYMYTDTIHDYQWENITNLYLAAVKYEVVSLKLKCSSFFKANLSLSKICDVLVLADSKLDADLISAVQGFISEHSSEVFTSNAWKELEKNHSTLAFQTLREICLNK
ncbi:unnamed protein product [Larinioides sclopetarius]|uniref:BTB domain-containing protein n=1 Tax=Larinioides sclopetarius TaxID=280406 RepID=A0AAV2B916_9ARAC